MWIAAAWRKTASRATGRIRGEQAKDEDGQRVELQMHDGSVGLFSGLGRWGQVQFAWSATGSVSRSHHCLLAFALGLQPLPKIQQFSGSPPTPTIKIP